MYATRSQAWKKELVRYKRRPNDGSQSSYFLPTQGHRVLSITRKMRCSCLFISLVLATSISVLAAPQAPGGPPVRPTNIPEVLATITLLCVIVGPTFTQGDSTGRLSKDLVVDEDFSDEGPDSLPRLWDRGMIDV